MNPVKKQTNFLDIKDKLKNSVLRLYDIPDYGQVDLNLVNMANFFPLLHDLIDSVRPRIVCEIGSDQGMSTNLLLQYCRANGAQLHVVDPALHENRQSDNIVTYYREMSIPYLQQAEPADIYFIDGDHNHYTVLNELRLIRDKNTEDTSRLLFLHDVGWPCGYMDMYYDKTSIEQKNRKQTTSDLNISVFHFQYTPGIQGLPIDEVSVAIEDGGKANGVLAAIEDFLDESPEWIYCSLPSIYGLGVLWYGKGVTQEISRKLERLAEDFGRFRQFLSILEFNRIILLEKLEETGELWKTQNEFIAAQNSRIEELVETRKGLEERSAAQGREWEVQNEFIAAQNSRIEELVETRKGLEERSAAQGREWEAQKKYIGELVSRNVNLDLKMMELESVFGWLRHKVRKALLRR